MIFQAMVFYILYIIPNIVGNILDILMQGNASKEVIMHEVYRLIFYSLIMIIPRIIYRQLLFIRARKSDTYLRKRVAEHLQKVKPEYYEKEEKGVFLAYLSKEILGIRKFLGETCFQFNRIIVAPIIGLIVIGKRLNWVLMLSILPIFPVAMYFLYKMYKKQQKVLETERKSYIKLSKNIEQNTSGFSLIKLYNEQKNQKAKFDEINEEVYKTNVDEGAVIYQMDMVSNGLYAACYTVGFSVRIIFDTQRATNNRRIDSIYRMYSTCSVRDYKGNRTIFNRNI